MNKRDLVIVALATFCLTASVFVILPSKSTLPYDPWADVTGQTQGVPDGKIDMRDISYEIIHFNAQGDPTKSVIVTNLCNESQDYALINGASNVSNLNYMVPYWGRSSFYCGGFAKLSMLINVVGVENLTNPVTFWVDYVEWANDKWDTSGPFNAIYDKVEPMTAINCTVYPNGGVFPNPRPFMIDVKGPYARITLAHTTSNNPQYSIMFNYTIYLRND